MPIQLRLACCFKFTWSRQPVAELCLLQHCLLECIRSCLHKEYGNYGGLPRIACRPEVFKSFLLSPCLCVDLLDMPRLLFCLSATETDLLCTCLQCAARQHMFPLQTLWTCIPDMPSCSLCIAGPVCQLSARLATLPTAGSACGCYNCRPGPFDGHRQAGAPDCQRCSRHDC